MILYISEGSGKKEIKQFYNMFIYSAGCSIASGYGMDTTYTIELAKGFGSGWVNVSRPGAGNDWIFHQTIEYLNGNPKPDWAIIQWSSPNRRLHTDISGKEWYVTIQDHKNLYPKFEPMGSLHTLHYMYTLQELLNSRGINWIFWNYFPLDVSATKTRTWDKIEWGKFVNIDRAWIIHNGMAWDEFGHPNLKGIEWITHTLTEKMRKDTIYNPQYKTII